MASRNIRHTLTVLGLARGLSDSLVAIYLERKQNKTALELLERIRVRCNAAFDMWPDRLNAKEIKNINKRMSVLEGHILGVGQPPAVLTAMALALLSDLHDNVSGKKRERVRELIRAYNRLNHYFDRRLDKFEYYDTAAAAVDKLYSIPA